MEQDFNANLKTKIPKRISKRRLTEYCHTLGEREKDILRTVQLCKFIQTIQIERLHFQDAATPSAALRTASRALAKLQEQGLVTSFYQRIGQKRTDSKSYIWRLTTAGAELLDLCDGIHVNPTRKRVFEPTYIFLKHTLTVVEVYTRLNNFCIQDNNLTLVKIELEPTCWRNYIAPHGGTVTLKPDLYAVTTSDDYEDHWFIEADLDTEAPSRVMKKCESYINYFHCGAEQEKNGVFPRVVWVVPDEKRQECLVRYIDEFLHEHKKLFTVITIENLEELVRTGAVVIGQATDFVDMGGTSIEGSHSYEWR